ncbi:MAG: nitroreductase [Sulfitobacter litoralis]|jgi:nitroreductase|uniref:nitroreductase n=1 Tax=Sulfitobacter TaxID=60136 RepID=UPI001B544706|nr:MULTISPECIES: nitroreductase [Sulfitobacter]MBQ0766772.1 nitroreductase [Sulfitobacter litoralis]MCF7726344.1 nitroreductase [Sulfitobacter sp. M22]MCF7777701.1 nitroreductase [Sulfitobacter sp. M220]|tara:strand:+ start:404 stop:1084 length:681 start_codon:yes stop_codon:yes gene_type:complete
MELKQAMQERRSIRGFKKEPVSRALLEEVVALANRAPSSMNTQPWHLHVLTGDPLEKVREGNSTRMLQGVPPVREISDHGAYAGIHRDRQVGIAKQLFAAMGIEREDKERRQDWVMRGFRQFDAPVSIVVCFDKSLDDNGTIAHFDLGAVTYGLVLAAWSKGLGCVINGQGIMQSPVVREHAQIPDDQVIMTCVAMGWPDEDFSANAVVSTRRPVEEVTRFVGFDD